MARKVLIEKASSTTKISTWDTSDTAKITVLSGDYSLKYNPNKDTLTLKPKDLGSASMEITFAELDNVYSTADLEEFTNYLLDNDFFNSASGGSGAYAMLIDSNVSGAYDIDWSKYNSWKLVLTGDTTLSDLNLPAVGYSKTITIKVTGAFVLTVPAAWDLPATYDGGLENLITVEYFEAGDYWSHILIK